MSSESTGEKWSIGRLLQRVGLRRKEDPASQFPDLLYEAVEKVLGLYVAGLMGHEMAIKEVEDKHRNAAYTDTRTIFLPVKVAEFPEERDNFTLFKLMAAQKCAQIQHGSFLADGFFHSFSDQSLFLDAFAIVENERVEFLLTREFKGLQADLEMARRDAWQKRPTLEGPSRKTAVLEGVLQGLLGNGMKPGLRRDDEEMCRTFAALVREIRRPGARMTDSMALARQLYTRLSSLAGVHVALPIVHYRGEMRLDKVEEALKEASAVAMVQSIGKRSEVETFGVEQPGQRNRMFDNLDFSPKRVTVREMIRGEGGPGAEHVDNLIWQDYDPPERATEVSLTEAEKEGAVLYDEWNFRWSTYRKEWCALRERLIREGSPAYVEKVLKKHTALVTQIRRQFEALRPELRRLRKQADGDEIDVDVAIEALIDQRAGNTPDENVYISRTGNKRDIAVAFLVDLSGSVGGWIPEGRILEIEKESMVLICEALQLLDDKYAIFGFSSSTRKQCDFYVIKGFSEAYDDRVRSKIAGMQPFNYTRMGASIRHLTKYLAETEAKIKLLILISDGKPNDFDGYAGRYGVEDTRVALVEARQFNIRTFCLTIDTEARTYVPEMFGEGNYIIIDNVARLPARLPEMYRRLTT